MKESKLIIAIRNDSRSRATLIYDGGLDGHCHHRSDKKHYAQPPIHVNGNVTFTVPNGYNPI